MGGCEAGEKWSFGVWSIDYYGGCQRRSLRDEIKKQGVGHHGVDGGRGRSLERKMRASVVTGETKETLRCGSEGGPEEFW